MKQLLFILTILAAMLCSCTQREPAMPEAPRHDELAALDTLMQTEPDSALYALLDFNDNHKNLTPFDRHYADLLLSEALFKCDYEQTLRTEVQSFLLYFDSLAAAHPVNDDYTLLSARAHYMNGVGFMESDSVVEACTEYLKALEIMEEHFEEKELVGYKAKFMALTYNRLGDLFSDQYMTEQAIFCLKESLSLFDGEGSYMTVSYLGLLYEIADKNDSAIYCYDKALKQLPDTNNLLYRDIVSDKAYMEFLSGRDQKTAFNDIKRMKEKAYDDKEIVTRSFSIGCLYFRISQYDSAVVYLKTVFNDSTDYQRQLQVADYLGKIYDSIGEPEESEKYFRFLAEHTMSEYGKRNVASKLNDLLQQYLQKKQERVASIKRHYAIKWFIVTICFLALISLYLIIMIRYKAKKKIATQRKEAEAKQDEIQEKSQQIIENERLLHIEEKEKLEKEIAGLKESLEATLYKLKHAKGSKKAYEDFLNEPVCCSIIKKIQDIPITTRLNHNDYININLEDETIAEYFEAVLRHFENFMPYLKGVDPNMEQEDVLICCLYLLGFEDKHIAFLRHKNFSSLNRRTNNLQKTFKTQRKFSDYIRKIAFEKYMAGK